MPRQDSRRMPLRAAVASGSLPTGSDGPEEVGGKWNGVSRPKALVGPTRFELVTSPLSGVRSNQLSYEPDAVPKIPGARRNCKAGPSLASAQWGRRLRSGRMKRR